MISIPLIGQTTDIRSHQNEISVYEGLNVVKRFNLPTGAEFIDWNSDCILVRMGSDIKTIDHTGKQISSLNIGNRKVIRMTSTEIVIKEDNNLNYYNSHFRSIRKVPIL
jgi:hypothetical protein